MSQKVSIHGDLVQIGSANHSLQIIHGGARGADIIAGSIARGLGLLQCTELADWVGRGRSAGKERNVRMLKLSPDLILAFKDHFDYSLSYGGTEHMVRITLESKIPVYLYSHSDGWHKIENRKEY